MIRTSTFTNPEFYRFKHIPAYWRRQIKKTHGEEKAALICSTLSHLGYSSSRSRMQPPTPLHIAAIVGNAEMCRLLLAFGADVNSSMEYFDITYCVFSRSGGAVWDSTNIPLTTAEEERIDVELTQHLIPLHTHTYDFKTGNYVVKLEELPNSVLSGTIIISPFNYRIVFPEQPTPPTICVSAVHLAALVNQKNIVDGMMFKFTGHTDLKIEVPRQNDFAQATSRLTNRRLQYVDLLKWIVGIIQRKKDWDPRCFPSLITLIYNHEPQIIIDKVVQFL